MTDSALAAPPVRSSDLRVGAVIVRSRSLVRRHLLTFLVVSLIACAPMFLFAGTQVVPSTDSDPVGALVWILFNLAVLTLLDTFGKAILVHAAFQDMRGGGRGRLMESLNVSLRQFWPLIGLTFASILIWLAYLLIVPGLFLATICFVALPACIVERLGPWTSLRRSVQLTKGHRWKIFWLLLCCSS